MEVVRRGSDARVTQDCLNRPKVCACAKEIRRAAVSERMRADSLVDPSLLRQPLDPIVHGARRELPHFALTVFPERSEQSRLRRWISAKFALDVGPERPSGALV